MFGLKSNPGLLVHLLRLGARPFTPLEVAGLSTLSLGSGVGVLWRGPLLPG